MFGRKLDKHWLPTSCNEIPQKHQAKQRKTYERYFLCITYVLSACKLQIWVCYFKKWLCIAKMFHPYEFIKYQFKNPIQEKQ